MRKAPEKESFEDSYPNIGCNYKGYANALAKWAKEAKEYIKKLEHHKDVTIGLWATDKPKLINDPKKNVI